MVIANDMMHTFIDGLQEYIRVSTQRGSDIRVSTQRGSDVTCVLPEGEWSSLTI